MYLLLCEEKCPESGATILILVETAQYGLIKSDGLLKMCDVQ